MVPAGTLVVPKRKYPFSSEPVVPLVIKVVAVGCVVTLAAVDGETYDAFGGNDRATAVEPKVRLPSSTSAARTQRAHPSTGMAQPRPVPGFTVRR
jgi:hypothetical protein